MYKGEKMNKLIEQVKQWHHDRNLIDWSTDLAQFSKLMEEVLELHEALIHDKLFVSTIENTEAKDAIGDIMVVLINIAERNGLTLEQCLEHAYNDIQHRKGKMVDGVFVKEEE
jgi:NTP pyrophosphatase (non-canonical NTP hydrolase)